MWWPGINKDLEEVPNECEEFQQNQKEDQRTPFICSNTPSKTWQRGHLDFAGPFFGQMCLIVVDVFLNGLESHQ